MKRLHVGLLMYMLIVICCISSYSPLTIAAERKTNTTTNTSSSVPSRQDTKDATQQIDFTKDHPCRSDAARKSTKPMVVFCSMILIVQPFIKIRSSYPSLAPDKNGKSEVIKSEKIKPDLK